MTLVNEDLQHIFALAFLRKISILVAVPPFPKMYLAGKNRLSKSLYSSYTAFIDFIFVFTMIRNFTSFIFFPEKAVGVIELFIATCFMVQCSVRIVIFYRIQNLILNHFKNIQQLNYIENEEFKSLFESRYEVPKRFTRFILFVQFSSVVLTFAVVPFFVDNSVDLLPFTYIFISYHDSLKLFYQIVDFLLGLYFTMRSTMMDAFTLTVFTFHTAQQEFLKKELRKAVGNLKEGPKKNKDEILRDWFKLHQDSLRHVEELISFLEPLLTITYIYNLFAVINSTFLFLVETEMNLGHKIISVGTNGESFAVLGWLCILVDRLNQQIEEISAEINIDHVMQHKSLKRKLLILIMRCQRGVKITAKGFFVFHAKNFTEVLSGTLSLIAALWQIKKRSGI